MSKQNTTKIAPVVDSPDNLPRMPCRQVLCAANDNGRRRRTVTLTNFTDIPVQAGEIAVIDALMQAWPVVANDNFPVD